MAVTSELPSDLPQRTSNLPINNNKGLSTGAAVGLGVGIALLVILGALGVMIFVRRPRRTLAQKRKTQSDPEITEGSSNEETTRRLFEYGRITSTGGAKEMKIDGVVEIGEARRFKGDVDPTDGVQQDRKLATEIGKENCFAA